jgi:hypothetical protein
VCSVVRNEPAETEVRKEACSQAKTFGAEYDGAARTWRKGRCLTGVLTLKARHGDEVAPMK